MEWKAKKIDIFDLKHRNWRPICICLGCHSHGFAALKHCYCQPISMLLHERRVSKNIEKSAIYHNTMTHNPLQNSLIFPIFTASRDVVRKYAKGEEVFVKKKDNWNSTLSMDVFGSVWWNGYGVVGAWLRTQCDELRLYVWPIFWCVNIVTYRNLPLWKMPLNYWYSSMAISMNKQANHSPPFWGGVGGEAVTLSLTCFLPATWLPRYSFRPSRILSWRRR